MTFLVDARAALDAAGEHGALYGHSAAYLHQLTIDPPEDIRLLVPWESRPKLPVGVTARRTRGAGRRPIETDPLPHTDLIDTMLDLTDRTEAESAIYWLTEGVRRGLLPVEEFLEALDERKRHRHRRLITEIADDLLTGVTSNLELHYAHDCERRHALPQAVRQFIVPTTGHRADFAYPEAMVLIETDGLAFHMGPARERDERLDRTHAEAGWLTLRFTWAQIVGDPCVVAHYVADVLRRRGMSVDVVPCPREAA